MDVEQPSSQGDRVFEPPAETPGRKAELDLTEEWPTGRANPTVRATKYIELVIGLDEGLSGSSTFWLGDDIPEGDIDGSY
jgi:hypothetical protein